MISVIIPTRNRSALVSHAVASALDQTYHDLEVVVVDDASDDDTPRILRRLAEEEPRLRSVRQPRSTGASAARNAGVRAARGELIAFLDDDSVWDRRKLERQRALLTGQEAVVYCRHAILTPDGKWIVGGKPDAAAEPLEGLLRTNYIGTNTLLLRRDLFDAAGGFDEHLPRLQDWDLLLRLGRRSRFAFDPRVLARSQWTIGGISLTPGHLPEAAERIAENHAPHLTPRQLAALQYGLGKFLFLDGHAATARRFFLRSVRLDATSALNWTGLFGSLLGPIPARAVRAWRRRLAASEMDRTDWDGPELPDGAAEA